MGLLPRPPRAAPWGPLGAARRGLGLRPGPWPGPRRAETLSARAVPLRNRTCRGSAAASSRSCVITTTVVPAPFSSRSSSTTPAPDAVSSAPVGSSARSSGGSPAAARATVPPYEIPALFEPFRRLGADRLVTSGGAGLGLSIVRAVARAHGGDAVARPATAAGSR